MISHEHKCIFIHISKCAGSSIENAFNIDISNNTETNNKNLFGWCNKNNLFLQHATPQQLLDFGYISKEEWDLYYKFIIIRNPWERAVSDYTWLKRDTKVIDSFKNYLFKRGKYRDILSNRLNNIYRGDHLSKQKDYFFVNGKEVNYDCVIPMEQIKLGLNKIIKDLSLHQNFFEKKVNLSKIKYPHYSYFYNPYRKLLFESAFKEDILFFNYKYEERKNLIEKINAFFPK